VRQGDSLDWRNGTKVEFLASGLLNADNRLGRHAALAKSLDVAREFFDESSKLGRHSQADC
jgi:hypothetical protein